MKKTKIVATISDKRCEVEFLEKLYRAGMNVVRLNTAHQDMEQALKVVENVRKVSDNIAILIDTKGPEVRTMLMDEPMHVDRGETVYLTGDPELKMDEEKPENSYPNTFVPGRNMVFLTFAAIVGFQRGISHLVTGVSQADFSGYPDCRDTFIRSLNVSLNLAMDAQFEIHTPLMWRDKEAVWALSDELGVFDLVRQETLTCYNGIPGDGCGHCPACKLRRNGLEKYLSHRHKKTE